MSEDGSRDDRCPFCGHRGPPVVVHGHGQCERCHTNVEPCCSGADAANEPTAADGIDAAPDPSLFRQLFEHLGGIGATVTTDSLLFALTQRLGTDLDDARLVLEAAERVGVVVRTGGACHRLRVDASTQRP